ncbi:MAG: phage holin family protein [Candidatus Fermentibacteraceae bacterium]
MGERSENRRGGLIVAWAVSGLSLYLTSLILGSRMSFDGFWSIALTALAVGLLNFLLGPLLSLITCPLIILTLGLARFLVSGLILLMASWWTPAGFHLASFWWAVLAAVIVAVLNGALERVFRLR